MQMDVRMDLRRFGAGQVGFQVEEVESGVAHQRHPPGPACPVGRDTRAFHPLPPRHCLLLSCPATDHARGPAGCQAIPEKAKITLD